MSEIVKASITKDGALLSLKMENKEKSIIINCLTNIESNIQLSQRTIAEPLIEIKKNEMILAQNKLQISEDFRNKLNDKRLKDLKTNELRFSTDVLYANIVLSNASEIKTLMDQLNKSKTDLSPEQTKDAGKLLPINIERKKFPSLILGGFLGLFLGIMVALIKQTKI
jgi:ribosome-binding factor A